MEKLHTKEHKRIDELTRNHQGEILNIKEQYTKLEKNCEQLMNEVNKLHKLVQENLKTPTHTETIKEIHKLQTLSKSYTSLITAGENIICIEDLP